MILIKNAKVYSPKYLGIKNLIIGGEKILDISSKNYDFDYDEVFDCENKILVPGFIDQHVHITGGGGEGSFHTRVIEANLSEFIKGGITTVVGLLGTDSITRSVENLLAKTMALNEEGISAYCLTGAYSYPSITITGSISKDITFLERVIGLKVAINDHRDSAIQPVELARLASEARVSGMISGKSGHVTVHVGSGKFGLSQIEEALEISNLPRSVFRPTHINRNEDLYKEAIEFARKGGYIDLTAGMNYSLTDVKAYEIAKSNNVLDKLSFSTDGFGSWSKYDESGNLLEIGYSPLNSSIKTFREIINSGESIDEVLKLFTSNLSKALKLKDKGSIEKNKDADILILDDDLSINSVVAKGEFLLKNKEFVARGTYE